MTYDPGSSGALAYLEAAREVAERGATEIDDDAADASPHTNGQPSGDARPARPPTSTRRRRPCFRRNSEREATRSGPGPRSPHPDRPGRPAPHGGRASGRRVLPGPEARRTASGARRPDCGSDARRATALTERAAAVGDGSPTSRRRDRRHVDAADRRRHDRSSDVEPRGARSTAAAGEPAVGRRDGGRTASARRPRARARCAVRRAAGRRRSGPNPKQPRTVFDEDALDELVGSIREIGVLQPIVVRDAGDGYELIMGERRWRATQAAGLATIPAIIRDTDDADLLRDALLENLHRVAAEPARGGGRLPAAARRLRLHARAAGDADPAVAAADLEHAPPAEAAAAGPAPGRRRACCPPATPVRCSG